jgi:predicted ATPase
VDVIRLKYPPALFSTVTEVARDVLRQHHFTRDDITNNPDRALQLQQLILNAQFEKESNLTHRIILSDRSGIDPIVYAVQYGPPHGRQILEKSLAWSFLRYRMTKSLIFLCPPHKEWLNDDGTRLMAESWDEWHNVHILFVRNLQENDIPFHVIPIELVNLADRVDYVLNIWRKYGQPEPGISPHVG